MSILKLAGKSARKRKPGDVATNARKRYYRSAERYLDKAKSSVGAAAARYRQLAKKELDNALDTYAKKTTQKFSKPIQRLANELGVNLEEERSKLKSLTDDYAEKIRSRAIDLGEGSRSSKSLASSRTDAEKLRQSEARTVLNSPIGSRILGGFVDVWKESATVTDDVTGATQLDRSKILPALFDYFKVDNLADMLEKVEGIIGDKLYADEDSDAMYEAVKIMLQNRTVTTNNVIAQ